MLAREDDAGDRRLVAYVAGCQESATSMSELRSFLRRGLPEYMVPSDYVVLKALPLTSNGKVDRQALPAPDRDRRDLAAEFVPPSAGDQETLAEIWRAVLGMSRVGAHDNFFDLGGHSLQLTQVNSRLRDAFQVELPLRRLFEEPTIAGLVSAIVQIRNDPADPGPQTISRVSRKARRPGRPGEGRGKSGKKRDREGDSDVSDRKGRK